MSGQNQDAGMTIAAPIAFLLLPALTDIRGKNTVSGADSVEVPMGSGRYYRVRWVEDSAKGFTNEHRIAVLNQFDPFAVGVTPAVAALAPGGGPAGGGTTVTITGVGFEVATDVLFDGVSAASFTITDDEHLDAVSPAHSAGAVDVEVVSPLGTSVITGASVYTYAAASLYSLNFVNGSSTYVDFGDVAAFRLTGPFSVSVWLTNAAYSDGRNVVSKMGGSWVGSGFAIGYYAGGVIATIGNGAVFGQTGPVSTPIGLLTHIVVTWDGSVITIYKDGASATSVGYGGAFNAANGYALVAGGLQPSFAGSTYYEGAMDALRYYDVCLTPTQITELYGGGIGCATAGLAAANLLGWWRFDEGSGTVALDSSGNGRDGTLINGPTYASAVILG